MYVQLARTLRQDILRGLYPLGSPLPTESELCARFGVSRQTVREALRRLREDHLVASRQGAGTVVVSGDDQGAYAQDILSVNDLVTWAVGKRFSIESIEMGSLPQELAECTGEKRDAPWLSVRGFGYEEGVTGSVCLAQYYIHRDFSSVARLLRRHVGPIFPLIEDLFGQAIVEVQQQISATLVSAGLAAVLEVAEGSAALEVRRTYKTADGTVAQVTINTHPASRYQHCMTMRRVKA